MAFKTDDIAAYYAEVIEYLAAGQLAYDAGSGEYRPLEEDDDEYVLIPEFIDDHYMTGAIDVKCEYMMEDKKLSISMITVYLQDVLGTSRDCRLEVWWDGGRICCEDSNQFTYPPAEASAAIFEALAEMIEGTPVINGA